jgi:hypothetical protein
VKFILTFFLFLIYSNFSLSQDKDSIPKHSVKKATILSAIIPGAGQIYNHLAMPKGKKNAFWKVPIIYAGIGATGYFVLKNNSLQKELKTEYNNRVEGNATLAKYQFYDNQGIITLYNTHLNQRDLLIVGFIAVYGFQILDAAVEAHFVSFDISEDLSLKVRPTILSYGDPGIKLSLNFVK